MLPSLIQISPVAGGVVAGVLHVILGPDHLCTIVTLSACQGAEAFWFGVRWAAGHLTGMATIGTLCAFLHFMHPNLSFEAYEHYAYYGVGFLLMFMGTYFILYADRYFDAEWAPRQASCACHAPKEAEDTIVPSNMSGYGSGDPEAHDHSNPEKKQHGLKQFGMREMGSVAVGFAQGIACPAGIVGMVFLKQYSPVEMVIFLVMFFTVTTLAMGGLAAAYGMLTRNFVSSKILGRSIYYASCALSLSLGALWIYLNATHRLDAVLGHHHDHGEHGHSHSEHSHQHGSHDHHHHHHMFLQEDQRLPDLFKLSH